jgi:type IV pilus assembly protein PilA
LENDSKRSGFTLIELMITVGIIGIIATIAIPGMIRFQLRAKAAEVKENLAALRVAEEAYFGEYGVYVVALPVTPAAVGSGKQSWPLARSDVHGFNTLGWSPDGAVHFQYGVTVDATGSAFTAAGRSDIDGDTNFNTWGYVRPANGALVGVAGPWGTCQATGVDGGVLKLVGPCDATSGRSVF